MYDGSFLELKDFFTIPNDLFVSEFPYAWKPLSNYWNTYTV